VKAWRFCGAVAVVAVAIAGGGAIREAQSAAVPSARPNAQLARLTKRVAALEQQVTTLQATVRRICTTGHVVSDVTPTAGQPRVSYAQCWY
jgi:uncharacterized protein YceH (UPF0502 family)